MLIFKDAAALHQFVHTQKEACHTIGFVPTMGALHEGHISLINAAKTAGDLVICSIFVNPTQFTNAEDLEKYPRTVTQDIQLLEQHGCGAVFLPTAEMLYPHGTHHLEQYDLGDIENLLEGAFRPGHFQGVCQVLSRLIRLIEPDHIYMGQKDYQQILVVRRLLQWMNVATQLIMEPIKRADNGLALSSRNARLSADELQTAPKLYAALQQIKDAYINGNADFADSAAIARQTLEAAGFKPDYLVLADAETLKTLPAFDKNTKMILLVAAYLGKIRLIDNLFVN